MKIKRLKSAVFGMVLLALAGCLSYKHEGFLDATTSDVPVGLLKGYSVRRLSVNFYNDETLFKPGRFLVNKTSEMKSIVNIVSEMNRKEMVRMMGNRYPEIIKNSQGVPIDIIIKLKSENFNLSLVWYFATLGILPRSSTCFTDCEIIVSTDRWRGSQKLRLRSESALTVYSPVGVFALDEPDEQAVSKNKDWRFILIPNFRSLTKSMRTVFAETLADTVVHIIKTAELKEFENNKKGN